MNPDKPTKYKNMKMITPTPSLWTGSDGKKREYNKWYSVMPWPFKRMHEVKKEIVEVLPVEVEDADSNRMFLRWPNGVIKHYTPLVDKRRCCELCIIRPEDFPVAPLTFDKDSEVAG